MGRVFKPLKSKAAWGRGGFSFAARSMFCLNHPLHAAYFDTYESNRLNKWEEVTAYPWLQTKTSHHLIWMYFSNGMVTLIG